MQTHPLSAVLTSRNLSLVENKRCAWTGGLTAQIEYIVIDADEKPLATSAFGYSRHPATYRTQGLRARTGTARCAALDSLQAQLLGF